MVLFADFYYVPSVILRYKNKVQIGLTKISVGNWRSFLESVIYAVHIINIQKTIVEGNQTWGENEYEFFI